MGNLECAEIVFIAFVQEDGKLHDFWECMNPRMIAVRGLFGGALLSSRPTCWKTHRIMLETEILSRARGRGARQQVDEMIMPHFETHVEDSFIIMWRDGLLI